MPVPAISVFYGIVISMFFNDHDPPRRLAQELRPLRPIEPLP